MVKLVFPERIDSVRLTMQRLRYEDAEEVFYTYASKPEATRFVGWRTHQKIEDTIAYLRFAIPAFKAHIDYSFSVRVKTTNQLIGAFGVINQDGELHFGYILSPSKWNQGFATEVCRVMLPLLKQKDVKRIHTFVAAENTPSIRVLQKCGLVEEGVRHGWFVFPNCGPPAKDCVFFDYPLS